MKNIYTQGRLLSPVVSRFAVVILCKVNQEMQFLEMNMGLQQFGVIPFEIRSLKIGHTEQRRTQRFYIVAIVRHRGTNGAWRNRGYLRVLLMFLSTSLQSSGLQDFLKCLLPKLSATRTLRLCRSLCLRHLREIVCFHLRVLPLSV